MAWRFWRAEVVGSDLIHTAPVPLAHLGDDEATAKSAHGIDAGHGDPAGWSGVARRRHALQGSQLS
jgi:hypothetical protein